MDRDGRDQDGGHQGHSRSSLDVVEVNPERSRQAEMVAVDVSVEGCRGWTWQEACRKSREQIDGCSEGAAGCRGSDGGS